DDWVELTVAEDLGGLLVLVGRGQLELRQQLQRALTRRATRDPTARQAILVAADEAVEKSTADPEEASRLAALLQFRAALTTELDPAFVDRLRDLAADRGAPFPLRVAAVRGLAHFDHDTARQALSVVAR